MHMLSRRDLKSAETNEEATGYVKELDKFVTVKLLEDTAAVLSLEKLW